MKMPDDAESTPKAMTQGVGYKNTTLFWVFAFVGMGVMALWLNKVNSWEVEALPLSFDMPYLIVGLFYYTILIQLAAITNAVSNKKDDTIIISILWMGGAIFINLGVFLILNWESSNTASLGNWGGSVILGSIVFCSIGGALGGTLGALIVRLIKTNSK